MLVLRQVVVYEFWLWRYKIAMFWYRNLLGLAHHWSQRAKGHSDRLHALRALWDD